jgi:hypothetical protein
MKRKILPACMVLCLAGSIHASAQSTLNATGGSATIGTTQLEWSVGEMALVNTFATGSIVVTQGVLQTGLRKVSSVPAVNLSSNLSVFPNPANELVNVTYQSARSGTMQLALSDMTGKVLAQQSSVLTVGSNKTDMIMAHLAAATYVLLVSVQLDATTTESMVYKIQKLQ